VNSPRELVREASRRYGEDHIARWCAGLLRGEPPGDEPALSWLGGKPGWAEYWTRVWGARGLLYSWVPDAAPAVVGALTDPAWRVREMAAKVVRLREIGEAADPLSTMATDDMPRVRLAAVRALAKVGEAEHAAAIRALLPEQPGACEKALRDLALRLDRHDLSDSGQGLSDRWVRLRA